MERLTSRENALIKEYRKLCGSRKRREETGCFVLEGARLVLDAAESGIPLRTLLVSDDGARYPEAEKLAGMARRCFSVPNELAAYISETEHPQGIFAVGEMPNPLPVVVSVHGPVAVTVNAAADPAVRYGLVTAVNEGLAAGEGGYSTQVGVYSLQCTQEGNVATITFENTLAATPEPQATPENGEDVEQDSNEEDVYIG